MKHLLLTTIVTVLLVGCGSSVHDAAYVGNIEAVKQYLNAGGDVNAKSDNRLGGTPLHSAAGKGHKELVELLIAKGASLRAKALWKGLTPLHKAASNGHREITELLIAKGADVNAKDDDGLTPLDAAEEVEDWHASEDIVVKTETADLLRKHGGKTREWLNADNSIHSAASAGHIEAVKQHIATGADVNAKDGDGWTPLHFAAAYGGKETVELLIASGADVNAKGGWREWTPLLMAAVGIETVLAPVEKETVELLIANGANVNALIVSGPSEIKGKTTLDLAKRHPELTDLLRKHGGKTGEELKAAGN